MGLTKSQYKESEVGLIPDDWNVQKLSAISMEIGDGIHTTPSYMNDSEFYFINGNNLDNGTIKCYDETKCVSKEEYELLKKNLNHNTILMSINGTIGNLAFFNNEKVVLGKSAAYINLKDKVDKKFIYFLLQHSSIKNYYEFELTGTTIRNLSLKSIRDTPIPLPPTKDEQSIIATALSDVDALIENLEKLIAKKRYIKKGVIQELLTGKKRLAGYYGNWGTIKIGEVADIYKGNGLSKTKLKPEGKYKCILYGELFTTYKRIIEDVVSSTDFDEGISSKVGDILIPGSTTTTGIDLAIASAVLKDNILLGGDINIIRPKNNSINSIFLAYYIAETMKHKISELTQGITIIHLYGKDLKTLEIDLPENSEQDAIAKILIDHDKEIHGLEKHMNKYKLIKQGMMQSLLTGKIRLI